MTRTSRLKQIAARVEAATAPMANGRDYIPDVGEFGGVDFARRIAINQLARSDVPWLLREIERYREGLSRAKIGSHDAGCGFPDTDTQCYCGQDKWDDHNRAIDAALEDSDDAE